MFDLRGVHVHAKKCLQLAASLKLKYLRCVVNFIVLYPAVFSAPVTSLKNELSAPGVVQFHLFTLWCLQ